jgi:hypothetical protein
MADLRAWSDPARVARYLEKALQVAVECPTLENEQVMWAVGLPDELAERQDLLDRLQHKITAYKHAYGFSTPSSSLAAKCQRVALLKTFLRRHPTKSKNQPPKNTELMRLAGFGTFVARSGSAAYMAVYRVLKEAGLLEEAAAAGGRSSNTSTTSSLSSTPTAPVPRPPSWQRPSRIDVTATNSSRSEAISPMTWDSTSSTPSNASPYTFPDSREMMFVEPALEPDDFFGNHYIWPFPIYEE